VDPVPDPLLLRKSGSTGNRVWLEFLATDPEVRVRSRAAEFRLSPVSHPAHNFQYNISLRLPVYLDFASGGGIQLGTLGTAATDWPIVPAPGNYDDGEFDGRGNRSTRRKPTPAPHCPQIPLDQTRDRTRAAAVGSRRLTA
jgi:hypothetical protein